MTSRDREESVRNSQFEGTMPVSHPPATRYAIAIGLAAVAVACRWLLDPWLPGGQISLVALPAVTAAAVWFGGYRAGIVTAGLAYVSCDYLFTDSIGFGPYTSVDLIRLIAVAVSTTIIIGFGEAARIVADVKQRERAAKAETDRTRAERALQATQERFSLFMRHLPGLAWIKDIEGRYVFANDAAVVAFGLPRQALYGRTDADVFPADVAAVFAENDRKALATGTGVQTVEILEHEDGVLHHSLVSKFPIPGPGGETAWVGGIAIDITERKRAEEALEEADRRKTEFLATLSHELRNPLAPIRNSLELVRRAGTDPAVITRSLDVMDRQTTHMVRLVDDLLDVNRITRDRLELRRSCITIAEVLHQAVETCAELADRAGHSIDLSLPDAPVYLDADPVRLVQVFGNLINNACKYSVRPGTIRVSVRAAAVSVTVSVADDGIGIPADALVRIFDMFAQVETGREQSRGSLGIGLTLAKRLVELHGGTVDARSGGLGCGSEFVVTLPAVGAEVVDRPATTRPAAEPGVAPLRVLVVDDNEDSAESLATLLALGGHETTTAHDGPEALAAAERFLPHVAILDVGLPTFSGHEVCRRLRARPWARDIFIVALTGWGQKEDRQRSIEAGFDEHFVKPLDHDKLIDRLRSVPAPRT